MLGRTHRRIARIPGDTPLAFSTRTTPGRSNTDSLCAAQSSRPAARCYGTRQKSVWRDIDNTTRPFSLSASFNTAAQWTSRQCGRASTFAVACVLIVVWAVTGPIFQLSDTWQLVINTGTTIVTFLMVFLIQHAEPR